MRTIHKTPEAIFVIAEIYSYTKENWGEAQAKKYIDNLDKAFLYLANSPSSGHMHPDLPSGYFSHSVGKHLVVYRADNVMLQIIAILHQAMDIGAKINAMLRPPVSRK